VAAARRRPPRAQRVLLVVAAVLAVLVVGSLVAFWRFEGNISAFDISAIAGNNRPRQAVSDPSTDLAPMNVLVMGSDTRTELEDASEFGGTTDPMLQGARSDTTLLVHLSADRRSATVVSIPRDSMVPVPDCDDPEATLDDAPVRQFNFAFRDGGPGCTVKTVEANTDIFVDHFAVVNFEGFQAMVDGLGGVDVCLPEPVRDPASGLDLPAGVSHVDGHTALQYVRARKEIGDGSDIGRIDRQQAFLSSVVQEATSTGLLLRPDRLLRFLDAATKSLTTDPEIASIRALSDLALQVRTMEPDQIRFVTVPIEAYPADPNRVQWADGADVLWTALRTDSPLPAPQATPSTPGPSGSATTTATPTAPPAIDTRVASDDICG
jgi:LCP family protein required for cell wall assembly